jgi:hypothetical protein
MNESITSKNSAGDEIREAFKPVEQAIKKQSEFFKNVSAQFAANEKQAEKKSDEKIQPGEDVQTSADQFIPSVNQDKVILSKNSSDNNPVLNEHFVFASQDKNEAEQQINFLMGSDDVDSTIKPTQRAVFLYQDPADDTYYVSEIYNINDLVQQSKNLDHISDLTYAKAQTELPEIVNEELSKGPEGQELQLVGTSVWPVWTMPDTEKPDIKKPVDYIKRLFS